jgi:hypothetical protein
VPIDVAVGKVCHWANEVLGEELAHLAAPPSSNTRGVTVHLLEMIPLQQARGPRQEVRLQIALKHLVAASSDTPEDAHQMLIRLLFAAMQHSEFEVDKEAPPLAMWQAFNAPPQPGFTLRYTVSEERPKDRSKLVRDVIVHTVPAGPLTGTVLGPGDTPIAEALLELPSLNASVRSDYNGRFIFPSVPLDAELRPGTLIVHAKGRKQTFNLYQMTESPLTIHITLEE